MFCHFWQKFENSKWPPFLGRGKFFKNYQEYNAQITLWVENFDEITLSGTVKEIEGNLCFAIFGKNSKIQNGRHFWGGENFLKITKSTKFVFCHFWQKFENSKWPPFLGRGKFFKNYQEYNAQIPCGSKI